MREKTTKRIIKIIIVTIAGLSMIAWLILPALS